MQSTAMTSNLETSDTAQIKGADQILIDQQLFYDMQRR
jgi:hypothetical protein